MYAVDILLEESPACQRLLATPLSEALQNRFWMIQGLIASSNVPVVAALGTLQRVISFESTCEAASVQASRMHEVSAALLSKPCADREGS